jgi:CRISPR/Cas system-associated exonuclease Cas4 (RecB family)
MKLKPVRSGKAEFLKVFNHALENTVMFGKSDPGRLYNLRCSQLPYCPANVLTKWVTKGTVDSMDLMMAYYVGVGHAVHDVMQRYLAQSGQFLADYECRECGKKYPLSYKHECCGFPTKYEEVTIDVKLKLGRIQGHIDGIFRDSLGRIWIVDFKTSSLASATSKEKSSPPGYKRQVRAYALLLKRQYKIDVHGVMLVYLPRDNPKVPKIWEYVLKPTDKEIMKTELLADLKLHQQTMSVTGEDKALLKQLLSHNCKGEYCQACKTSTETKLKMLKKNLHKLPIKK